MPFNQVWSWSTVGCIPKTKPHEAVQCRVQERAHVVFRENNKLLQSHVCFQVLNQESLHTR